MLLSHSNCLVWFAFCKKSFDSGSIYCSRVQWILSPRTVHWFFFRDALRNSFGSEDPHFPRHIQNFAKPETSFGWEIQKPRQQHNQLLHYEQLKARRGVAMLVMCHTKVIVTSAKTSMSCKNSGWKPTFLLIWPIRWLALWHRCVDYNHVGDMLTDMLKPHLKVRMVTCVYVWVIVCTICKKRRQKGRHVMTCDNLIIFAFKNYLAGVQHLQKDTGNTVDGQNPAPPRMMIIPLFIGFEPSQVVQDFFHQQYLQIDSINLRFCPKFARCTWSNNWLPYMQNEVPAQMSWNRWSLETRSFRRRLGQVQGFLLPAESPFLGHQNLDRSEKLALKKT